MKGAIVEKEALGRLTEAMEAQATEKSRLWWTRYLKGAATFRGVPTPALRQVVHAWWAQEGLGELTLKGQKAAALQLFDGPHTEDRMAGVLVLAETLMDDLETSDLPALASLFERGRIADWNLCDWFCVKVLGPMVERADDPQAMARAVSAWRSAEGLWQRRASAVAFVNLAAKGEHQIQGLPQIIEESCEALVLDPARFAQTGVGWTMRELSRAEPQRVVAFMMRHMGCLSREAARSITKKLPADETARLLAIHKAHSKGLSGSQTTS